MRREEEMGVVGDEGIWRLGEATEACGANGGGREQKSTS